MMLNKKEQRLRRARQTRIRIAQQGVARLSVESAPTTHIYASVYLWLRHQSVGCQLLPPKQKCALCWALLAKVATSLPQP